MERQNFRFSQRREADFALFGALCCFAVSSNASIPIQNSQSWNSQTARQPPNLFPFSRKQRQGKPAPSTARDSHSFEVNGRGACALAFSFDFLSAVENWQGGVSRFCVCGKAEFCQRQRKTSCFLSQRQSKNFANRKGCNFSS